MDGKPYLCWLNVRLEYKFFCFFPNIFVCRGPWGPWLVVKCCNALVASSQVGSRQPFTADVASGRARWARTSAAAFGRADFGGFHHDFSAPWTDYQLGSTVVKLNTQQTAYFTYRSLSLLSPDDRWFWYVLTQTIWDVQKLGSSFGAHSWFCHEG